VLTASVLVLASFAPAAPIPVEPPPSPTGRAFLGVMSQDGYSLVVGSVLPDMPAAKAGINPGDRLLRVGSFEPADFTQLSAHVQTYRPGATIEVELDRNGRRETLRVRLAARPATADTGRSFPVLPFSPNDK
jgi:S1-C subfamily serine protease